MSARFNSFMSDPEWAAYKAGQALAYRVQWMQRARNANGNKPLSKVCVEAARNRNHDYLKAVAELRALKAAPKRKRA